MAKTLENYDPLVQIPSGMTPAGADFPIVESHDILVGENDKRLDAKLDDIDSAIGNVGETPIATQLSSKVNTGDIVTSVAATGSTSNNKIPSETAVRAAIDSATISTTATPTSGSNDAFSAGGAYTELAKKVNTSDIQSAVNTSTNPPSSNAVKTYVDAADAAKVNISDIQTTVRAAASASDSKVASEKAVRSAIDSATIIVDPIVAEGSNNAVSGGAVHTQLATKQDALTFDTTPTASSNNPVTSGGVKAALDTKQNTLTYETTPVAGSVNPVTSTGIRNAIDAAAASNLGQMQAAYDTFTNNISARVSSLSNGMVACSNIAAETTVGDTRILLYTGTTNSTYTNGHWYYNSAASNAAPSWTDGGAVGSAPTIDNTLTVEGAAANSKAVGDAIENIVTISNTQPGSNSGNKVWIRETTNEEVQVPTYAEHIAKANKADIATNNESDNGSGTISASKAYAIGDHFYINNTNTSSENYGVSTLYKATAAIASGDAIVVGTNCEASKVADEITSLSNDIDTVKADLGNKNVLKTSEKTSVVSAINSFLQAGKNLYDPYRKTEGYFININTGDLAESTGQNTSDYISVTPNTAYTISWKAAVNQCRYAFYDSNKTFIANSGGKTASSVTSVTLTSPATAAFLRFSIPTYTQDRQVEKGDTATTYEPYTLTFDDAFVWSDRVAEQVDDAIDAHNFSIRPEDTTFFHVSKNMIDPSTCVLGEIVNQTNGAFSSKSAHNRTTYIEINPSTTYVIRPNSGAFGATFRYAFYTSNKVYISGAVGSLPDMLLTSPANAKYMVISATYAPSNMMIALYVDENKSFEAFDNVYVKPQFIVAGDADGIVLNLPEKVYALVGYELNIYFDNITENSSLYKWDVTCTKGIQLERGYRITPVAADVGTYTLTIRASISENIYKEVSTTLVVTAATVGSGDTATVIILGDSTTNNGIVIEKLNANFASDVMSISTLGTRGTSPNLHEGRSGWKLSDYFTTEYIDYTDGRGHVENPFYNPTTKTFDASYYFANSGVSVPDFFVVNMGINDVFGSTNDAALSTVIEQVVGYVDSIITSLKAVSQTLKICICCTIPPNHSQDAFGKAYACGQTRNRYKRNNTMLVERLIDEYDGRESEEIYLIPIHTNLDTVYNMGLETLPVNARNTDVTYQSPISNGGVHPVASGYWQIADVYTAFLKANA